MTEKIFDSIAYFKQLAAECRTCKEYNFVATECSGPDSIQGVMQQFRKASNFIMVSDTVDSNTHSIGGVSSTATSIPSGSWQGNARRDDMADREAKMNICRYIFRQFLSRMLHDKSREAYDGQMEFLDLTQVYSSELGRWSMNGVTGLYFMITSDEPIDIQYDESLWQTQQ